MPQFPWKPLRLGLDLDRQIDDAFRKLIHGQWGVTSDSGWQPEIDLFETEDAYIVEADVPGLASKDLRVDVNEHSITISGARESTGVERSAHGLRVERRTGSFSRQFQLRTAVDPTDVEHVCAEGLHRIRVKKRTHPPIATGPTDE